MQCIATGTTWGCLVRFASVSRKRLIRSSMKLSTLAVWVTGTQTAIGSACARGSELSDRVGAGVSRCEGLWSDLGSNSVQHANSLAKSVTVSENRHQDGGLGEPPVH